MEKEVETTYLEEKTQTETVTFCDACGLDCDDHGGAKTIQIGPAENKISEFKQSAIKNVVQDIRETLMVQETRRTETTHVMGERRTYDISIPELRTPHEIDGETAIKQASNAAEQSIRRMSEDRYRSTPEDTFDICGNCVEALRETEGTLETSLYENNDAEEDEEDDDGGGIVPKPKRTDTLLGVLWAMAAAAIFTAFGFAPIVALGAAVGTFVAIVWASATWPQSDPDFD